MQGELLTPKMLTDLKAILFSLTKDKKPRLYSGLAIYLPLSSKELFTMGVSGGAGGL